MRGQMLDAAWAACAVVCFVVAFGLPGLARAELPVRWDCYLPEGPVQCGGLERAYRSSIPWLTVADSQPDAVQIRVRSVQHQRATRFVVDFAGGTDAPHFRLVRSVRRTVDADAAMLDIVATLQRGTMPFLSVSQPGSTEEGQFRLEATDLGEGREPSQPETSSPWYVRPEVSGELYRGGVSVLTGSASLLVDHSVEEWRFMASAATTYQHIHLQIPGGNALDGAIVTADGDLLLAMGLSRHLSLAMLGDGGRAPHHNIDVRAFGALGLEWIDEPFLETSGNDVGVRYRAGVLAHDYVTPNVNGDARGLYPAHSLTTFARWHFEAVDLSADVTWWMLMDRPRYWELRSEAEATFRLADGLELSLRGGLTWRERSLAAPADPDGLDPLAGVIGGMDFGELSYGAEVGIGWAFGNSLAHTRDQRWR